MLERSSYAMLWHCDRLRANLARKDRMLTRNPNTVRDRRNFCATVLSMGALGCLACTRKPATPVVSKAESLSPTKHKFQEDSKMPFENAFNFAYAGSFVPILLGLAEEVGREKLVGMLKDVASREWGKHVATLAKTVPMNDLDTFVSNVKKPDHFWSHVLTSTIVEDSKNAFELNITECLWAKTFREANAADIGYACICHPDYAAATAFNPRIRMIRTKTLMQGDDCCNHRYVYDGT
jgi:hypothetical protein